MTPCTDKNILAVVNETVEKLCPELKGRIVVYWNNRYTKKLGTALYNRFTKTGHIQLSTKYWEKLTDNEKRELVIHETCHITADCFYNRRCKHGWGWKNHMIKMGIPANRLATIEHQGKIDGLETYHCDGCHKNIRVGKIQHRRLQSGTAEYRCGRCKCMIKAENHQP